MLAGPAIIFVLAFQRGSFLRGRKRTRDKDGDKGKRPRHLGVKHEPTSTEDVALCEACNFESIPLSPCPLSPCPLLPPQALRALNRYRNVVYSSTSVASSRLLLVNQWFVLAQ